MKVINMLLLLSFLVSCGKDNNNKKKQATITPEQVTNLLEGQVFTCDSVDGSACPDGIVRLFILNPDEPNRSGLCTGFLTRENRVLTNSHCVSTKEECDQTYLVIHYEGEYKVARCNEVIKLFEDFLPLETKSLDVSVLELDRSFDGIKTFKTTNKKSNIGDIHSAWVIDHISLFEARITQFECQLIDKTNSFVYRNCPTIGGNSGSPITNAKGEVVSILWGSTTPEDIDEYYPLSARRLLEYNTYATDIFKVKPWP